MSFDDAVHAQISGLVESLTAARDKAQLALTSALTIQENPEALEKEDLAESVDDAIAALQVSLETVAFIQGLYEGGAAILADRNENQ